MKDDNYEAAYNIHSKITLFDFGLVQDHINEGLETTCFFISRGINNSKK
jgi:hypothetical protein